MNKIFLNIVLVIFLLGSNVEALTIFNSSQNQLLNNISRIERTVFGYENSYYPKEKRLEIIETALFGTTQNGTQLQRLNAIENYLNNNKYTTSQNTIDRIKNKILTNNYGYMTGFEPQVVIPPTPRYYNHRNRHRHLKAPQRYLYGANKFYNTKRSYAD